MADLKTSALAVLDETTAAIGDLLMVVDVSDTTMAGSGTNKKMTLDDLRAYVVSGGGGGGLSTEDVIDAVAAVLVAGNNVDITYNDAANTITVDVETLTKTDVGLANVDNTADASKPLFSTSTTTRGLVPGSSGAGATSYLTGAATWSAPFLVLTEGDPIPGGTPAGTLVVFVPA